MTNKTTLKPIGILGGTFDPIHHGHLHYGQQIAEQLGLTQISLMPAHIPPHKNNTHANAQQRLEMVDIVCQQNALFCCDDRELKSQQKSFTVESLKQLRQEQPNAALFFFIGMDSLLNLPQWHQWQQLLTLCHIVVTERPGYSFPSATTELGKYLSPRLINDVKLLKSTSCGYVYQATTNNLEISSTQIRERIKQGKNCQYLLPESVLSYIKQHQLYR